MSITISTCDEICQSPTNTSPAKQLYSFAKTARFNSRRQILCDKFYQLPSTLTACRTTSLGFGNKYDFTHESPKCPSPNAYHIKSTFQTKSGFGFGKGREQMEMTGPLANVKLNTNPGPGSYEMNSTLSKEAFSLGERRQEENKERKKNPGPGTYPITFCINEKGSYFLSKYKSSCTRNFSKIGGRCQTTQSMVPGPGAYDVSKVDLSPQGRYALSKLQNCLSRKFAITTRKPLAEKNDVPGPGNYKAPSEFGYYISKKIFEKRNGSNEKKKSVEKESQKQN